MGRRNALVAHVCAILVLLSANCDAQTGSYLRDPSNVQNREHIREHMSDYYKEDDIEQQLDLESEESTRFHYFKLHDYDNNNKLDGLELYAAIAHYAEHHAEEEEAESEKQLPSMEHEQISKLVDVVLEQDDMNDDGFVDYFEFVQAQEAVKNKQV